MISWPRKANKLLKPAGGNRNSLTRQLEGMQNTRGLHRKGLAERERNERVPLSERAHKQEVLAVKKNMHLNLNGSTGAFVTVAISPAPDRGFHRESIYTRTKPAYVPHNMLREVKLQIARKHRGGNPIPHTSV